MRSEFKTALVLGIAILALVGIAGIMFATLDREADTAGAGIIAGGTDKSGLRTAPGISGVSYYLNTTSDTLAEQMEGKVVLYDIWTYSCINCIRTLPHITMWNEKYSDQGLLIVGIHTPEFEFEKDPKNVQAAMAKHGITYPVIMDNDWEMWNAFENRYWPRKYIADHEGYIRYDHIGEGAYKETEEVIQQLLQERAESLGMRAVPAQQLVQMEEFEHTAFMTPELYFGYKLAQGRNALGSSEGFKPGQTVRYAGSDELEFNKFYMKGDWRNFQDGMRLESDTGTISLVYYAKQVNMVAANEGKIEVILDGVPLPARHAGDDIAGGSLLLVDEPGLYNIINSDSADRRLLELRADGPGLEVFTLTFG